MTRQLTPTTAVGPNHDHSAFCAIGKVLRRHLSRAAVDLDARDVARAEVVDCDRARLNDYRRLSVAIERGSLLIPDGPRLRNQGTVHVVHRSTIPLSLPVGCQVRSPKSHFRSAAVRLNDEDARYARHHVPQARRVQAVDLCTSDEVTLSQKVTMLEISRFGVYKGRSRMKTASNSVTVGSR